MKIVIVGGGMAGLSAYLSLKKHLPPSASQDIKIYERHDPAANKLKGAASPSTKNTTTERLPASPQTSTDSETDTKTQTQTDGAHPDRLITGGGLGLAPNGMRTLSHLSPSLHARVTAAGFPATTYELRTAGNSALGRFPAGTDKPTRQDAVMISWLALWEELRRDVPDSGVLVPGRKVVSVSVDGTVVLDGGERVVADLVVGADGARSLCRRAVLEDGDGIKGDVEFQGLINLGGFIPTASLPTVPRTASQPEVVMTFGPRGFFGYTPANSAPRPDGSTSSTPPKSGDTTMWWSTFSSPTPQCPPPDSDEARAKLQELHGDWADPIIAHIVRHSEGGISTPTWIVPAIPRWSRGRVMLVGDAAHALPSTSGQGVSQAFEDVVTLGVLLGGVCDSASQVDEIVLADVGERYTKLRKGRVDEIRDAAVKMQSNKKEMRGWEVYMMYAFMWVFTRLMSNRMAAKANEYSASDIAEAELRAWKGGKGV